jgi:hypothetical protein
MLSASEEQTAAMRVNAINSFPDDALVRSITAYVRDYMKAYDASHSWDRMYRIIRTEFP